MSPPYRRSNPNLEFGHSENIDCSHVLSTGTLLRASGLAVDGVHVFRAVIKYCTRVEDLFDDTLFGGEQFHVGKIVAGDALTPSSPRMRCRQDNDTNEHRLGPCEKIVYF